MVHEKKSELLWKTKLLIVRRCFFLNSLAAAEFKYNMGHD